MCEFPVLNFPGFNFRVRKKQNAAAHEVWDELRKVWLVLTPEEWVRRHVIRFLCEVRGVPAVLISQECPVCVQGMKQRADIVVYGKDGKPFLLVECKSPSVNIDVAVYAQALRYNNTLGAEHMMLTNGNDHYLYSRSDDGEYRQVDEFPKMNL